MVSSVLYRGLIYAGDTPLAMTIAVEQTGPMQLTVHAGSFTSTGQARLKPYVEEMHYPLVLAGKAEAMNNWSWVRVWLQDANGNPIDKSKTYTLVADQVINLTSDPLKLVAYDVDLISDGIRADVLVKRKVIGREEYGDPPLGWTKVHELLFEFVLPPGSSDVTPIDICALTVKPGFPPSTGPEDWRMQTGSA